MSAETMATKRQTAYTPEVSYTGDPSTDAFLNLLANPFQSQIQSTSFLAALIYALVISTVLVVAFCLVRPRITTVYAPRAKYMDEKHKPPVLDDGLLSWIKPIKQAKEDELVSKLGLDAVVFLRFMRMVRNIFIVLTILGCAIIIPINLTASAGFTYGGGLSTFMRLTPQFTGGNSLWAFVVLAYVFDFITFGFMWWNYRAVLRLRRNYFDSDEYRSSLHSRTLMITRIPKSSRTDDGLVQITQTVKPTPDDIPKTAIARNVKDLPDLIEEHEETVKKLEKHLAKYLADPNKLPAKRPTCKPSSKDKAHSHKQQVDAIDYLTDRVRELETEIKQVRESVDQRNPMAFGFASYTHIEDAHSTAFLAKKKGPEGTTVRLAPKPHDIIWKNMSLTPKQRKSKVLWNSLWMTILTVLFIVPNVLVAIFLSDFQHLAVVWPSFQGTLERNPTGWAILQGISAPLVQQLFYMFLPAIFRKMYSNAGDTTKTSRERHVTSRLYIFFVFNNLLVFSLFAVAWTYAAAVIGAQKTSSNLWEAIQKGRLFYQLMVGVCQISPYWLTWQIQRNLGAATDIVQLFSLMWQFFQKRFMNPSPRELVELTAPQPFPFADYYNNYLFVATVGICFACVQPIILPVTAFYLVIDCWFKNYLLQYVFVTRVESGGMFWRMVINRLLAATVFGNAVIALLVGGLGISQYLAQTRDDYGHAVSSSGAIQLYVMVPLPFLIWAFKWYCRTTFDPKMMYYTTQAFADVELSSNDASKPSARRERVGVRFGNPALYKKLITPMVAAKSKHLLREVYRGRLDEDEHDAATSAGYSDVYMSRMHSVRVGKPRQDSAVPLPFDLVSEADMDFEHFRRRADFRDQFGADSELYGMNSRPGTPASHMSLMSMDTVAVMNHRKESPTSSRASSRTRYDPNEQGTTYKKGYHNTGSQDQYELAQLRNGSVDITSYDEDRGGLLNHAQAYGAYTPGVESGSSRPPSTHILQSSLTNERPPSARGPTPPNAMNFSAPQRGMHRTYPSSGANTYTGTTATHSRAPSTPLAFSTHVADQTMSQQPHVQAYQPPAYQPQQSQQQQQQPLNEDTSYDYFRRGRK